MPSRSKEEASDPYLLVRTDGGPEVRTMTIDQILRLRILLPESHIELAPRRSSEFEEIRWQELPFSRTAWLISASRGVGKIPDALSGSEQRGRRATEPDHTLRTTAIFAAVAAAFFAFVFFRPPSTPEAAEPMVTVEAGKLNIHNESGAAWVRPVVAIKRDSEWYEFAVPGRIQPGARVSIALPYFQARHRSFPANEEPRVVRLATDSTPPFEINLGNGTHAPALSASVASAAPPSETPALVAKPKPRISTRSFFANSAPFTE